MLKLCAVSMTISYYRPGLIIKSGVSPARTDNTVKLLIEAPGFY